MFDDVRVVIALFLENDMLGAAGRITIVIPENDSLHARGLDIIKTASERDRTRAAGIDVADRNVLRPRGDTSHRDVPGLRCHAPHGDVTRFIVIIDVYIANDAVSSAVAAADLGVSRVADAIDRITMADRDAA
jgi:hypothetical protein